MKVLKNDKYEAILLAARKEFIKNGFKGTSMRSVASNANVGLSNIYNYFQSKDELFLAVVSTAKETVFTFIRNEHTEDNVDMERLSAFNYQEESTERFITILCKYREEIRMMLYCSDGSSLNGFRDSFTDYLTELSCKQMIGIKKRYPQARDISPFFFHTLSSSMVNIIGEIVTHDLNKRKIRDFFKEYFRFEFAGWRELIEV